MAQLASSRPDLGYAIVIALRVLHSRGPSGAARARGFKFRALDKANDDGQHI